MLLMALFAAAPLVLSPLPAEIPDTGSWDVPVSESFRRTIAEDLASVQYGALAIKYLRTRGICPEDLQGDCTYTVRYEIRRLMEGDKMVSFVQRYAVVGPTGVRQEGIGHFSWVNGEPTIVIYFLKGDRWLTEEPETEEYVTATGFSAVLAERHDGSGF